MDPNDVDAIRQMNPPISISDAASMLRKKVNRNDRPYTQSVVKCNNALVDEWYQTVLCNTCNKSGQLPATHVENSIRVFLEGRETEAFIEYSRYLPDVTEDQVRFWLTFFRKPVDELHRAGGFVLRLGWDTLVGAIKAHYARQKWEIVYSQTTDPVEREKLMNANPSLLTGEPLPFDIDREELQDMKMKVHTILGIRIEPEK